MNFKFVVNVGFSSQLIAILQALFEKLLPTNNAASETWILHDKMQLQFYALLAEIVHFLFEKCCRSTEEELQIPVEFDEKAVNFLERVCASSLLKNPYLPRPKSYKPKLLSKNKEDTYLFTF